MMNRYNRIRKAIGIDGNMKNTRFMIGLKILFVLVVLFGIWFNTNYFHLLFITDLSPIRVITMLFIQSVWLGVAVMLLFFGNLVYTKRKELLLFLVVSVLCLAVAEAGFRVFEKRPPRYVKHHYLNWVGTPDYRSHDGLNMHNSLGYRGDEIELPKPESTYRIVTMGGSTTYTYCVKDWKKDFARQLEKELQDLYDHDEIEVINAGVNGWSSWESLINLQVRILDLEPDLIIVYHGVNDVLCRMVNPDYYTSDNSGCREQWEDKSFLANGFFSFKIIQRLTQIDPILFDISPPTYNPTTDPGYNEMLGMTGMEALNKNKPIYFERNLRSMIAIAKEYNVSVLLSTWAYSEEVESSNHFETAPHFIFGFEENNDVVKKVGKSHDVPVYDFASEMPDDKELWHYSEGMHVNEKGAELKGELFANFIYKNKIMDDKIMKLKNGN